MFFFRSYQAVMFLVMTLFSLLLCHEMANAAIDCFSCHDRADFQKRVNHEPSVGGDCLACHNPHVARFEGLLQDKIQDLCFSCHTEIADELAKGVVHQPVQKGGCLDCHNPHAADVAGLLNARTTDICFNCHSGMPKKFKNTHEPYAKGQCSSCHKPHQSSYPYLLVKEAESLCLGCHSPGSVKQMHPDFPAKLGKCSSCHNPHGSDRPALVRNILHEPFAEGCDDCHVGQDAPVLIDTCLECHSEVSEQMASSHNHLVRYEDNGCMACHSPHAGDDERLLKGKERHICGKCHEATFKRWESLEYSHQKTDACNNCHAPHGSNHPAMANAPINEVCSKCHGKHIIAQRHILFNSLHSIYYI